MGNAAVRQAYYQKIAALMASYGMGWDGPMSFREAPIGVSQGLAGATLPSNASLNRAYPDLAPFRKGVGPARITFDTVSVADQLARGFTDWPNSIIVHENAHASRFSGNDTQARANREEARATAAEMLLTPLVQRQLGLTKAYAQPRVGADFWEAIREHPYRSDPQIGPLIPQALQNLKARLGAALYPGRS